MLTRVQAIGLERIGDTTPLIDWLTLCGAIGVGGGWSNGWPLRCTLPKEECKGTHADARYPFVSWNGDLKK